MPSLKLTLNTPEQAQRIQNFVGKNEKIMIDIGTWMQRLDFPVDSDAFFGLFALR